jgi:hypothetical protein
MSCQYGGGNNAIRQIIRKTQIRILRNRSMSTLVEDKHKLSSSRFRNVHTLHSEIETLY